MHTVSQIIKLTAFMIQRITKSCMVKEVEKMGTP